MKKIILFFVLFLLTSSMVHAQFDTDKRTGRRTVTENVWDTITLQPDGGKSMFLVVEVYSGTVCISFSQAQGTGRDSAASYDSVTSTDKEVSYSVRNSRKIYIKGSGGTAVYQVKWSFGTGYGRRIGTSGSSQATPNFSGYAYKDSLNTFSMAQTMDSAIITRLGIIDTAVILTSITSPIVNATTGYQLNGTDISWGVSNVARTGIVTNFTTSYVSIDSLTLNAGTYCITYTMQNNFLTGSGTTLVDHAYMQLYSGSAVTASEVYHSYPYTTVGVGAMYRTLSWNVIVSPATSTKYYFQIKMISNTGLTIKLTGYTVTAIKVS